MNFLFIISAIYTLIIPPMAALLGLGSPSVSMFAFSGIATMFLSKVDHLSEFALGPLRAKIRKSVDEANATVRQLQELACQVSEVILTTLMAGNFGFQDGLNLKSRITLHDQVMQNLKELAVSENSIIKADQKWRDGIGVIYFRQIGNLIDGSDGCMKNLDATDEEQKNSRAWSAMLDQDSWIAPDPDRMRSFMQRREISKPEIDACIDDYAHFLITGEIRRKESFINF